MNRSSTHRALTRRATVGLAVGAAAIAAVLALFAVAISSNQSRARRTLEVQAHEKTVLVSGLIATVLQLQTKVGRDARLALAGDRVPRHDLDDFTGDKRYVALLSSSGRILSHSHGFTATDRADVLRTHPLSLIAGGRSWGVGDITPGGTVDLVSRIDGLQGTRALVTGVPLASLSSFVVAELRRVPGVLSPYQSLVDGRGVVVGSTTPGRPAGYVFHTRYQLHVLTHRSGITHAGPFGTLWFDQVPLGGTNWKLVVSVPVGRFFASVSGLRHSVPWIILALFGVMAYVALALVARSLIASARIRAANAMLTDTNVALASAQAAQARANAALERSNLELERQAQELVRSNAELDQFASIASHDLQEPLRKVRTFNERITETEAENLTERGRDYLARANASAERMQTLIEDLLRLSRVTTQARPFTSVDLGAVVADVLDDLSEQVRAADARVEMSPLPTISADAPQIRQLMQNLVSNALKFRRDDVVPVVRIDGETEAGWLTLTVADNGIGFEPQYAQRIFRVFERLHGRGTYPGTGIGLALCRKIAERHGGTVVAEGVPGEGTTFTVTMQTERTEAVSATPAPTDPEPTPAEEPYVSV